MTKKNSLNRKQFLGSIGSLAMGSLYSATQSCTSSSDDKRTQFPEIPKRKFGNTGIEVPELILGAARDMRKKHPLLTNCVQYGVNYWDTSALYSGGMAEAGLGDYFKQNPGAKEKVFTVTKADDIWDNSPDIKRISKDLETSLHRMGLNQLDGYVPLHATEHPSQITPEVGEWARKQKEKGKFRFVGLSTHSNMAPILMKAAETDWIDFVYTKYNFELFNDEELQNALDACYNAGKGIVAIKTQRTLSKTLTLNGPFESDALENMVTHFLEQGFTEGQAKLKLVLDDKRISAASVGMEDVGILMQNVAAILDQSKLSQADVQMMEEYKKATSHLSCLGCSHICKKAMPEMPYVADVLRYMVYHHGHCHHQMAKQNYHRLPIDIRKNIKNFDYRKAEAVCPQKIAIGELIKEAADLMA
ncbi:aldo/keto reductase [Sunxiuqinia sp. A32]|uniref:aldo/keto reductase n=1 Tax=Sunxiuqinia sp. A32 TaxID=3461496 RepID=UPI004046215A